MYDDSQPRPATQRALGGGYAPTGAVTLALPVLLDLLDKIDDALLLVGVPAARILHANESASRLLDRRHEDLVGLPIESIDPEMNVWGLLRLSATLRESPQGRLLRETVYETAGGQHVPVEVSVRSVRLDGEEYHICVARDVGERRRADWEMRQRHEQLFRIFNGLDAAVYVIDAESCRVLAHNDFAAQRFGATRGVRCKDAAPAGPGEPCPCGGPARVRAAAESGQPLVWEFQHATDGRWYRCIESAIPWVDGRLVRLEVTLDVSEERRLQAQLQQSQKMDALGRLAGGVAHDFNNILNGIIGFSELLRGAAVLGPEETAHLDAIARSALRGADLTGRILGFSRRTPPEIGPVRIDGPVNDAVRLVSMTTPPTIHFDRDLAPDVWRVQGNAAQIEQIVLNLCMNAADAMAEGGAVTVRLGNVETRRPLHTLSADLPPGRYVRLRVRDEGAGMHADDVARAFEPFFTTKAEGSERRHSGLGLSVVWGVVRSHGGGIRVRTRPGGGTSFEVYLPAAAAGREPVAAAPARPRTGQGQTVLVVDDEPMNVELLRILLEREGYRVTTASDGAEAVASVERLGAAVDLIILDLVMPRMDGAEALRRIREIREDVPVLITSGYDAKGVADELGPTEHTEFLAKPYSPRALLARVAGALQGAVQAGGA